MSKKFGESILSESQQLSKQMRIKLVNYLGDLISEDFDGNASKSEINIICAATIQLFPSLADENGGIVSIFCFNHKSQTIVLILNLPLDLNCTICCNFKCSVYFD